MKQLTNHPFSRDDFKTEKVETVYKGYARVDKFHLTHKRFDESQSNPIARECFNSGDAVIVLPYDPIRDEVLLIEQFRVGPIDRGDHPWIFECIAGRIEPEETPEDVARREAVEEAGLSTGRMEEIGGYFQSPGIFAEHITYFCAEADLSKAGGVFGLESEDEDIRAIVAPREEAAAAAFNGQIVSAPTALALAWLELNASRLREIWK